MVTATPSANEYLSGVHGDVILTHILGRLDGPALASAACASSHLRSLSTQESLWSDICRATWPSTDHPRMQGLISTFPDGPRSFYSDAFPSIPYHPPSSPPQTINPCPLELLVSAVDIHYKKQCIFSKVVETETTTIWELEEELELTWIIVDPNGHRAANFSSWKPVSVHRHWISGDIQVKFATVMMSVRYSSAKAETEMVQCGIVVTFGGDEEKGMRQVMKEVSFQVEDMEGICLNGKESLGILQRALGSGQRRRGDWEEWRGLYEEYVKRKEEMKEWKMSREVRLDALCTALVVSIVAAFSTFLFFC
ncbi:hypothetical protein Sjap_001089 [Stephania japonica]|uniref:F-box domain-containing protein n=1 Tax=Stephania japonica TaxID=461633 RepID=A0AAP0PT61_9MAGN